MHIEHNPSRLLTYIGGALLAAYLYFYLLYTDQIFWDLAAYERAITEYNAGLNPYQTGRELNYVYPPFFMKILSPFEGYIAPIFLAAFAASLSALLHPKLRTLAFASLFCVGLGQLSIIRAIFSGNVTLYIHILILFCWAACPRRRVIFYLILIIAAVLKPYFLAYLILPLVHYFPSKQWIKPSALTIAAAIAIYAAQLSFYPTEFQNFITAITDQTGYKRSGLTNTDLGEGLYMLYFLLFDQKNIALALHAASILALVTFNLKLVSERSPHLPAQLTFFLLPVMIAVTANPRLKVYDVPIMTMCAAAIITLLSPQLPRRFFACGIFILASISAVKFFNLFYDVTGMYRGISSNLIRLDSFAFVIVAIVMIAAIRAQRSLPSESYPQPEFPSKPTP